MISLPSFRVLWQIIYRANIAFKHMPHKINQKKGLYHDNPQEKRCFMHLIYLQYCSLGKEEHRRNDPKYNGDEILNRAIYGFFISNFSIKVSDGFL